MDSDLMGRSGIEPLLPVWADERSTTEILSIYKEPMGHNVLKHAKGYESRGVGFLIQI